MWQVCLIREDLESSDMYVLYPIVVYNIYIYIYTRLKNKYIYRFYRLDSILNTYISGGMAISLASTRIQSSMETMATLRANLEAIL